MQSPYIARRKIMKTKFKKIVLMGRRNTEGVVDTLSALVKYLQTDNLEVILEQETAFLLPGVSLPVCDGNQLHQCDLIIVVGGDGSLLHAARISADQNIPVLGVNRGNLGFLTDIHPDDIEKIHDILKGEYFEETRFLLAAKIKHGDDTVAQDTALNDVVLLPSEINRMMDFSIYIDNQFVCTHRADGMIVATPTGSTAHALSGGGPILHPGLDAIVLVPMFPHTLSSRPIVVKGDSNITIVMSENCKAYPKISCDGQKHVAVPVGGQIFIHKYEKKLRLIHLHEYNYYETLRAKLKWESK